MPILISRLGYVHWTFRLNKFVMRKLKCWRYLKFWYKGSYEQSLSAYQEAYDRGYRAVVINIRQTKDKHLVCWHDDDVSDVAFLGKTPLTKEWKISEHSLKELELLQLYPKPFRTGGKIMKWTDVLPFIKKRRLIAEIEIKGDLDKESIDSFLRSIKQYEIDERLLIIHCNRDTKMLKEFGRCLSSASLSTTGNSFSKIESIINLDVSNRKLVTITNYQGRTPETLSKECLSRLKREKIDVIFSEVKNCNDKKIVSKYLTYFSYVASRFPHL